MKDLKLTNSGITPNNITFTLDHGATEVIKFDYNGDIYVKGKLIENDKEVVDAFREFLTQTGNLKERTTKLISAFPGTGKSHYYRSKLGLPILDSDSSDFSWIVDDNNNKIRNPEFPDNYIKHIKENLGKTEIIFISSHKEVREKLVEENLDFYLVYPERGNKQEYIDRYIQRGSPQSFIDLLEKEWDNWITELDEQENCTHVQLKPNEYITDILNKHII